MSLVRLDDHSWERSVVGLWLMEGVASALGVDWDTVCGAMDRLPTNSVLMLDTAEGCAVVASAVAMVLGQPAANLAIVKH